MTLANPWDFLEGSHHLPSTFLGKHVYRYVLGGSLRALLCLHQHVFLKESELPVPRSVLDDVLRRRTITLRLYDELITSPLYGFANPYDYYSKISSCRVAPDVRIPFLSIKSIDDPITGPQSLPINKVSVSFNSIPTSCSSVNYPRIDVTIRVGLPQPVPRSRCHSDGRPPGLV